MISKRLQVFVHFARNQDALKPIPQTTEPIWSHARLAQRITLRSRLDPEPTGKAVMGAGGKFQYPKEVWSPAGGWWPYPKKWRSNTVACFFLLAGLCVPIFMTSERLTVRVDKPAMPIPWRPSLGSKLDDEDAE